MQAGGEQPADAHLCHDRAVTLPTAAAAIIAGGRAQRFGGQDKSRLVVRGRTIIVRQLEVLQRVAGAIFVVAPDPRRFADLGVPVHADVIPGAGALGGIYTALETARAELVLTVACDLPFLSEDLLRALLSFAAGHDGAWIHTTRGIEPLLACYRRSARQAVHEAILAGDLKAADLGRRLRMAALSDADVARYGRLDELLANVNTPDDHARIQ
jgi:molybdopterin-guanine dinucleotide biosynthesis protein A